MVRVRAIVRVRNGLASVLRRSSVSRGDARELYVQGEMSERGKSRGECPRGERSRGKCPRGIRPGGNVRKGKRLGGNVREGKCLGGMSYTQIHICLTKQQLSCGTTGQLIRDQPEAYSGCGRRWRRQQ